MVSGLFVVFNIFYLQPRLATPNIKQTKLRESKRFNASSHDNIEDVAVLTDAEIATERHNKMHEARRIILFSLGGILLATAFSRFLYGISSSFEKPTCLILMFIGKLRSLEITYFHADLLLKLVWMPYMPMCDSDTSS